MELDAILAGTPAPAPTPVTDVKPAEAPTPEPAAPSAATPETPTEAAPPKETEAEAQQRARDEHGRFTKPQAEPAVDGRTQALREERRKRQELEAKLAQFEAQKPKTDFFENPTQAFKENISAELAPLQERFFKLSLKSARAINPDFDEVSESFAQAAESDPRLHEALRAADDPGEFIYTVGKQIRELSDVGGDITKYRTKIEGEWKGKYGELETRLRALEAENAALKASREKAALIPQSTNAEASAPNGAGYAGPTPLKALFN